MIVSKNRMVEVLRGRGQNARADWVQRQLPDEVDTDAHAGLLVTLRLGAAELADDGKPGAEDPSPAA